MHECTGCSEIETGDVMLEVAVVDHLEFRDGSTDDPVAVLRAVRDPSDTVPLQFHLSRAEFDQFRAAARAEDDGSPKPEQVDVTMHRPELEGLGTTRCLDCYREFTDAIDGLKEKVLCGRSAGRVCAACFLETRNRMTRRRAAVAKAAA